MRLEILHELPATPTTKTPLLFVHGAFSGAWCWSEHFLSYFAQQGYPAYAVSLRGHAGSDGILHNASLNDYVNDVAQAASQLKQPPVLIGHSMGGVVVQKYVEKYPAAAMILMNSVPPTGLLLSSIYMLFSDPFLTQQIMLIHGLGPRFTNPNLMRRAMLSDDVPDELAMKYYNLMQGESARVVWDLMGLNLPTPWLHKPTLPILVLGANHDAFTPPSVIKLTAALYDAPAYIFKNMAHAMMLDSHWREVANKMRLWLDEYALNRHIQPATAAAPVLANAFSS